MKKPCKHETDPKKMTIKMGGLLCPKCRTILHDAYTTEWKQELKRRRIVVSRIK